MNAAEETPKPKLTEAAESLLRSYPARFRDVALSAVAEGKAFCPACHFAGQMNCAHFDECEAFIMPDGDAAKATQPPA